MEFAIHTLVQTRMDMSIFDDNYYNDQTGRLAVDREHQVIPHAEALGRGQDNQNVAPMVDGAKENLKNIGQGEDYFEDKILTADTNYHNQYTL
jgi:hypothetical protein